MLCNGPERRIKLGKDETDPLIAGRAFPGPGRWEEAALWMTLGQVHAYRGGLGDDGAAVVQHRNLAARIDSEEPRFTALAAHHINLDVFISDAEFFERPESAKRAPVAVAVELHAFRRVLMVPPAR